MADALSDSATFQEMEQAIAEMPEGPGKRFALAVRSLLEDQRWPLDEAGNAIVG